MKRYKVYQRFYSGQKVIEPGEIIECREIDARIINYIQPMTLRLVVGK